MQKKTGTRSTTICHSLQKNMIVLILLLSGAIMLTTFLGVSRGIKDFSEILVRTTNRRVEAELNHLFKPMERNLLVACQWLQSEPPNSANPKRLNNLFIPMMEQYPQVSSIVIASTEGYEYFLHRKENKWLNRISRVNVWGSRTLWYQWKDENTLIQKYWEKIDYDPRLRPWFQGAMALKKKEEIYWTKPYLFFTTKEPGITASTKWEVKGNPETTYVIAFDVLLSDISTYTVDLKISGRGKAFVLTGDELFIGLPWDERFKDVSGIRSAVFSPAGKLGIQSVTDAIEWWKSLKPKTFEPFLFKSDGEQWWGGFSPFFIGKQTFWIGVIEPKMDILAKQKRRRIIIICITFGAIALAVLISIPLARRYGEPLEALAEQSNRIRNLDLRDVHKIDSSLKEINQLAEAQMQILSALQSFARYIPLEVIRELLKRGEVAHIGGKTMVLTILFTDIRGFTAIAEKMTPQALTAHMADYFEGMLEVLHAYQATVTKFIGDAIIAFWGAPKPDSHQIKHAVKAILRCQRLLNKLNFQWREKRLPSLPTCFGLHVGPVVVGNIGAHSRMNYTVLGDAVNLASRLEGLNRIYGTEVLASEFVCEATGKDYVWRYVDLVTVKGKEEAVKIYELLGKKEEVAPETLLFINCYEEALRHYQSRQFKEAINLLQGIQRDHPLNPSILRLIKSCENYLQNPPPRNWDGVTHLQVK